MSRIAARLSTNLLLLGENGTGKELIAQAIHNGGNRSNEPFIAINCGAIPKNLIESELFGFEGGAGGGRDGRAGKFELANGGTVFVEEISAMPFDVQAKLFNVLQEGAVSRLGSDKSTKINVRVIAASSKDLLLAVRNNEFHGDLYYRLNGLSIHCAGPPGPTGRRTAACGLFFAQICRILFGQGKGVFRRCVPGVGELQLARKHQRT
jgi:transcriptional regulator with PAS, ATPase and Fis domain